MTLGEINYDIIGYILSDNYIDTDYIDEITIDNEDNEIVIYYKHNNYFKEFYLSIDSYKEKISELRDKKISQILK